MGAATTGAGLLPGIRKSAHRSSSALLSSAMSEKFVYSSAAGPSAAAPSSLAAGCITAAYLLSGTDRFLRGGRPTSASLDVFHHEIWPSCGADGRNSRCLWGTVEGSHYCAEVGPGGRGAPNLLRKDPVSGSTNPGGSSQQRARTEWSSPCYRAKKCRPPASGGSLRGSVGESGGAFARSIGIESSWSRESTS